MVLRYMVSDTDLTKGEVTQPQREAVQPKESISLPKKKSEILAFVVGQHDCIDFCLLPLDIRKTYTDPGIFPNRQGNSERNSVLCRKSLGHNLR